MRVQVNYLGIDCLQIKVTQRAFFMRNHKSPFLICFILFIFLTACSSEQEVNSDTAMSSSATMGDEVNDNIAGVVNSSVGPEPLAD